MPKKLKTVDGATLMAARLPPIRYMIEGLLPQGLHLLAGAPKVGKSWLALWLCLCVAKGETVWGFAAGQSDVLYLCLEDSYSRIQNRLLDLTDDAPENLYFATMSEKLRSGLEQQVEHFLSEHPATGLVVIDTLQRVQNVSSEANPYAGDYRDLGILKELADRNHTAVLLIHHLRKMGDDDPMNMISGTTGISGATDSNFVLRRNRRGDSSATLYCTGRDIEYRELSLEFDPDTHIWRLLADSVTAKPEPRDALIPVLSDFLNECKSFTGTATQLAEALAPRCEEALLPATLTKRLLRGREELAARGVRFELSRTRDHRELRLTLAGDGSDGSDGKNDMGSVSNLPSHLSQPSQEKQR